MKDINPFSDVSDKGIGEGSTLYGSELMNLQALQVGAGAKVLRSDESGFWLGAEKWADAPFRIDMLGNVYASSLTASGYIAVGGAASDVNSGATTINGTKITASSITGTQIAAGTITALNIAASTITANEIASDAITSSKIKAGAVTTSKLAAGAVTANEIAADAVTASKIDVSTLSAITADLGTITAGNIDASLVTVSNISASNITAGTLSVGNTGQPSSIVIRRNGSNGYLTWEGGNKIWSDENEYMGFTADGERFYFYTGPVLYALFQRGSQAGFYAGVNITGGGLNVGDSTTNQNARITGNLYLDDTANTDYINSDGDNLRFYFGGNAEFYHDGVIRAIIDDNIWTDGDLYADGSKPFLIRHPDGSDRFLRYTAQESPDVVLRYRGIGLIEKGVCEIIPPEHFILVTEPEGLVTVNLTPMADDMDLYISKVDKNKKIVVKSRKDAKFMFEVMAIRKGYLDSLVEIDPSQLEDGHPDKNLVEKIASMPQKTLKAQEDKKRVTEELKPEMDMIKQFSAEAKMTMKQRHATDRKKV